MQPGTPDLGLIVRQAQQMQQNILRAQAELAEAEVTGSAGGGLVQAMVTGSGELLDIVIDPSVVDPSDVETLTDLIVAAIRDATREARELSERTMGPLTGGMASMADGLGLPPMPGM